MADISGDAVATATVLAAVVGAIVAGLVSRQLLSLQFRELRRTEGAKIASDVIMHLDSKVHQRSLQMESDLERNTYEKVKLLSPIYKALMEAQEAFESLAAQAGEKDKMFVRQATSALQKLSQFSLVVDEPKLLLGSEYDVVCQKLLDQFARIFLTLKATQEERKHPESIRQVEQQLQDLNRLISDFRGKAHDFARAHVVQNEPRHLPIPA